MRQVPERAIDERARSVLERRGMKMDGEIVWVWQGGQWGFRLPIDNDLGAPLQFIAHVSPRLLHRPVMVVLHRVSGECLWRLCVNSAHAPEPSRDRRRREPIEPVTHKHYWTDALVCCPGNTSNIIGIGEFWVLTVVFVVVYLLNLEASPWQHADVQPSRSS
ncbi:MAG: hypothetical protein ACR2HR_18110 [Euzebya sp.]